MLLLLSMDSCCISSKLVLVSAVGRPPSVRSMALPRARRARSVDCLQWAFAMNRVPGREEACGGGGRERRARADTGVHEAAAQQHKHMSAGEAMIDKLNPTLHMQNSSRCPERYLTPGF